MCSNYNNSTSWSPTSPSSTKFLVLCSMIIWALSSPYSSYPQSPLSRLVADTGADLLACPGSEHVLFGLQSKDSPKSDDGIVARRLLDRTPLVSRPDQSFFLVNYIYNRHIYYQLRNYIILYGNLITCRMPQILYPIQKNSECCVSQMLYPNPPHLSYGFSWFCFLHTPSSCSLLINGMYINTH